MANSRNHGLGLTAGLSLTAVLFLSACAGGSFDWDMRSGAGALDTTGAAQQATGPRPVADAEHPTAHAALPDPVGQ